MMMCVDHFVTGDLFERSFDTTAGRIDVLADVHITGRTIELRDIAVYPDGAEQLQVDLADLARSARTLLQELADAGFDRVVITGTRVSGARRGRRVHLDLHLPKGRQ